MDSIRVSDIRNPREKASSLSILLWWWAIKPCRAIYQKKLSVDNLCNPLEEDRSSVLGDRLEKQWNAELQRATKLNARPNLAKSIFLTFRKEIFWQIFLQLFAGLILKLCPPLLLGQLMFYFTSDASMTREQALAYAGLFCLANLASILSLKHYNNHSIHTGMKIRVAIVSLVYRKALKLNLTALSSETSTGAIVNIVANDVNRLNQVMIYLHYIWSAPLLTIAVSGLVYVQVGFKPLIGVVVLIILVFIQVYTGKLSAEQRRETSSKTDERVRLMDEIISGVQVIKMYAWEKTFCKLIELVRHLELRMFRKTCYPRSFYMTSYIFATRLSLFFALVLMVFTKVPLVPREIFLVASFYNALADSLIAQLVRGYPEIVESSVTVARLKSFLMLSECKREDNVYYIKNISTTNRKKTNDAVFKIDVDKSIILKDLTVKWRAEALNTILESVNVEMDNGKLYAVIGKVGSGKSSLLAAILGETHLVDGCAIVNGRLSYLHQNSWVFASTVHRNVVFCEKVDEQRYRRVIDVCCLSQDFEQFPEGDRTVIGEKGVSLSGGQKARISLARAIYRQADIYLLDDPLSAVDAKVGKHLFEKCVLGYLAGKTRVLVLHQLQYLKDVDGIFHVKQGRVEFYPTCRELVQARPHYAGFIAENVDVAETPSIADTLQFDANDSSENDENNKSRARKLGDMMEKNPESSSTESRLYLRYFSLGSGTCNQIFLIVIFVLSQIFISAGDYMVALLSNSRKLVESSTRALVYVYAALIVLTVAFSLARSLLFFWACLRSSEVLHSRAFRAVVRAPMSFFHSNPSGRLLNRFSNDMGSVDENLPKVMLDTAQIFLCMLGVMLVTCSVNGILVAPVSMLLFLCLWLRRTFLVAAMNMKRLEATTKSPLLTYLNETLNGICTIRAVKSEDTLKRDFDHFQDVNTSAWYICLNCTFLINFSVELIVYAFTTLTTFGFVLWRDHFSGSQVGLVITQMMSIVVFIQIGMRMSFESANEVLSVERILEYANEKPEANLGDANNSSDNSSFVPLPNDWPSRGEIRFTNVFLRYVEHGKPILKDINLIIRPREKIGIVGRTGAGKSSLIAALFRLAKIEGVIEIDGIDTGKISLEDLRKNISIIPQDPVLFSGTLRRNLDPLNEFSDDELWRVLDEVELRGKLALDAKIADKGRDYSCGERQLVCLARAILRKNRILLLDEATANVDPQTDSLIQRTIRERLADCTVLTIAHRLNTVIDSDRVAVMDNGSLLEFDQPYALLQREESHLSKLVRKTGDATFDRLFEQAKQFHSKKL